MLEPHEALMRRLFQEEIATYLPKLDVKITAITGLSSNTYILSAVEPCSQGAVLVQPSC